MEQIAQLVGGLLMALFLPGFIIAVTFFEEMDLLEKLALGIALSISIDIAIGIFLGYNGQMRELTGGITSRNLWIYTGGVTGFLLAVFLMKRGIRWIRSRNTRKAAS